MILTEACDADSFADVGRYRDSGGSVRRKERPWSRAFTVILHLAVNDPQLKVTPQVSLGTMVVAQWQLMDGGRSRGQADYVIDGEERGIIRDRTMQLRDK
jgi:hypothetical protein